MHAVPCKSGQPPPAKPAHFTGYQLIHSYFSTFDKLVVHNEFSTPENEKWNLLFIQPLSLWQTSI